MFGSTVGDKYRPGPEDLGNDKPIVCTSRGAKGRVLHRTSQSAQA